MEHFYVVVCEDGAVRHHQPFTSGFLASDWENWGHCCTNSHTTLDFPTEEQAKARMTK